MSLEFTILGCADSHGVPRVGNDWGKCDPRDPKNARSRASLWVKSPKASLVVDTGTDFRAQTIKHVINHLDAVLYSHAHSDHIAGIDDIRHYVHQTRAKIPIYANEVCLKYLMNRYDYLFQSKSEFYPALADGHAMKDYGSYQVKDIEFQTYDVVHGHEKTTGFRFADVGYTLDFKEFSAPEKAISVLKGIKIWIVDCGGLLFENNPVHASMGIIQELNASIQAERIILSSLSSYIDYERESYGLPDGYELAYDGLSFKC